jgi:hypothetical protein
MSEPQYTYEPIEFYGRVRYNANGALEVVEVSVNGTLPQQRYPEAGDNVGDCFRDAFEDAKTLLLTQRLVEEAKTDTDPSPPTIDVRELGPLA